MATAFDSSKTARLHQWELDLTDKGRGLLSWWNIWVIDSVSWGPEKLRWMMGDELETKERVFGHGVLQVGSRLMLLRFFSSQLNTVSTSTRNWF